MSNLIEMRFTIGPTSRFWQLQPMEPCRHVGLLGWVIRTDYLDEFDGSVPLDVVGIILRALCRSFRVTFFHPVPKQTSSIWESSDEEHRCMLWSPWLPKFFSKSIPLVSTVVPERAQQLFDATYFDWYLQGQIVLISSADDPPPVLGYWQMAQLMRARRRNAEELGLLPDIVGMMFPGVDGDFAQFVSFEDRSWSQILGALESECRSAGVKWRVVDEAEFNRDPWIVDR